MASRQYFHRDETCSRHRDDEKLGDPITDCDRIRHCAIGVKKRHPDLAAISRIHRPGAVDDRDAVPCRQSAARNDESGETIRKRDRYASGHRRPLSGRQFHGFRRAQVGPGIARVGVFGDRLAGDEHFNGFCHESRVVQNG
jgi:hypothetical protein